MSSVRLDLRDLIRSEVPFRDFCSRDPEAVIRATDRLRRNIPGFNLTTFGSCLCTFEVLDGGHRVRIHRVDLPALPTVLANKRDKNGQLLDPISLDEIPSEKMQSPRYVLVGSYLMEISSLVQRMLLRKEATHPFGNRDFTKEEANAVDQRICAVFCISREQFHGCWGPYSKINEEEKRALIVRNFSNLDGRVHSFPDRLSAEEKIGQLAEGRRQEIYENFRRIMVEAEEKNMREVFSDLAEQLREEGLKEVVDDVVDTLTQMGNLQDEVATAIYLRDSRPTPVFPQFDGKLDLSPITSLAVLQVLGEFIGRILTEPEERERFAGEIRDAIERQEEAVSKAVQKCRDEFKEVITGQLVDFVVNQGNVFTSAALEWLIGEFEGQKRCDAFLKLLHPDVRAYLPAFAS